MWDSEKWICHAGLTDRNWWREGFRMSSSLRRCESQLVRSSIAYRQSTQEKKNSTAALSRKMSANISPCWRSSFESLPKRLQCCILFPSWTAMVSWSSAAFHFLLQLINISASWRAAGGWVIPSAADFGSRAFVVKYFKQNEKRSKFCCLMIFCLISATQTAAHTGRMLSYNLLWLICTLACIHKVSLHPKQSDLLF